MGNLDKVFIRAYTKQSRQSPAESEQVFGERAPEPKSFSPVVAPVEASPVSSDAKTLVSEPSDRPWLRIDQRHGGGDEAAIPSPHSRGPSQSEGGVRVDRRPPPVDSDHCEPADLSGVSEESGLGTIRFRHAPHRLPPYPHLSSPPVPAHEPVGTPSDSRQPSLRRTLSAYLQLARQVQREGASSSITESPQPSREATLSAMPRTTGDSIGRLPAEESVDSVISPAASAVAASLVAAPPSRQARTGEQPVPPSAQPASPLPPPNLRGWERPPAHSEGRPHHLPVPTLEPVEDDTPHQASQVTADAVAAPELSSPADPTVETPAAETPAAETPAAETPIAEPVEGESHGETSGTSSGGTQQRVAVPFQAVWEVDAILWPESIYRLCSQEQSLLEAIGQRLTATVGAGLKVLAVTSADRGEGRTTVAACLAHSGSQLGLRVALVDGDLDRPALSEHLNLEVSSGWLDAIADGISVEEVAVHSIEDQVTLVPLKPTSGGPRLHPQDDRIQQLIQQLADGFDLVIIDAGQINAVGGQLVGSGPQTPIDAAVLVVDHRRSETKRIEAAAQRLRRMGIESIGLVENFRDDR